MRQTKSLIDARDRYIEAKERNRRQFRLYSQNLISKNIYEMSKIPLAVATKGFVDETLRVMDTTNQRDR